jgi:hypothetical protein
MALRSPLKRPSSVHPARGQTGTHTRYLLGQWKRPWWLPLAQARCTKLRLSSVPGSSAENGGPGWMLLSSGHSRVFFFAFFHCWRKVLAKRAGKTSPLLALYRGVSFLAGIPGSFACGSSPVLWFPSPANAFENGTDKRNKQQCPRPGDESGWGRIPHLPEHEETPHI